MESSERMDVGSGRGVVRVGSWVRGRGMSLVVLVDSDMCLGWDGD